MILMRLPRFCSASGMFEARVDGYHVVVRKKVASLRQRSGDSQRHPADSCLPSDSGWDNIQDRWMKVTMGLDVIN